MLWPSPSFCVCGLEVRGWMGGEDGARWGEENYPGRSHGPSSEGRGLTNTQACPGPSLGELEGDYRPTARTWGP